MREQKNDIVAKLRELKRQCANNVGESTGLGIGNRFGRNQEQIQGTLGHGRASPHCSQEFVANLPRRHARRARGDAQEEGIFETIC
jgi:hypothetical protein